MNVTYFGEFWPFLWYMKMYVECKLSPSLKNSHRLLVISIETALPEPNASRRLLVESV